MDYEKLTDNAVILQCSDEFRGHFDCSDDRKCGQQEIPDIERNE